MKDGNSTHGKQSGKCSHGLLKGYIRHWWPTSLTVLAVLWLTLAPDPAPDVEIPSFLGEYADKVVHAIMMGGITAVGIFDYKRRMPDAPRPLTAAVVSSMAIAVMVFSLLDEWAQGVMGLGRSADIWDFAADFAGMVIALLIAPWACNVIITGAVRKSERDNML